MFSGECVLIIDGRRFGDCTSAMEERDVSARSFGFLSAPPKLLERARAAQRVEIGLGDHPSIGIKILAINCGIALFTFLEAALIRVTLSTRHWMAVVEGAHVREVCIRAERQLCESGLLDGGISCHVLGADDQTAAAISEYISSVECSMMPISPGVIHEMVLASLERSIARAEQLVSRQRQHVDTMEGLGWPDELSIRVLENLSMSLTLLNRHRDIIRQELPSI